MEPVRFLFFLFFIFFVSGCRLSLVWHLSFLHLPTHAHVHMEGEISTQLFLPHSPPQKPLSLPKDPDVTQMAACGVETVGGRAAEDTGMPPPEQCRSSCCPRPAYREGGHQPAQPAPIDLTGDSEVGEDEERTTTRGLALRVPAIKRGPERQYTH